MKYILIVVSLLFSFSLFAEEPNKCLSPDNPKYKSVFTEYSNTSTGNLMVKHDEVFDVLCCCNTSMGQCCNYQSACLGLVRGCICDLSNTENQ